MRAYSHIPVLLSAAALLTALSSCSKVETTERRDASITFRSSVVTKAPVDTDGQIDRFAVWAYRSDDAATLPEVEMNGIEVYRNGTGWAYDMSVCGLTGYGISKPSILVPGLSDKG